MADPISAIILAAGLSRRFQENKLLYPLQGKALFRHLLETVQKIDFDQIIVVSSYPAIQAYAHQHHLTYVHNPEPERGISYSIKLGIEQKKEANHLLFLTADTPYLQASTLKALMRLFSQQKKITIVSPSYQGEYYQPNLFHRSFTADLLQLEGDKGGKILLHRYADAVIPFVMQESYELHDIDRPSDLFD